MERKKLIKIGLMVLSVGVTGTLVYFGFQAMRKNFIAKKKPVENTGAANARTSGDGTVLSPEEQNKIATDGRGAGQGKTTVIDASKATKGRG